MKKEELRKMDCQIAEQIFGFPKEWSHSDPYGKWIVTNIGEIHIAETNHYTENMDDAFMIVGELQERGLLFSLIYKTGVYADDLSTFGWEAAFRGEKGHFFAAANTPALAICMAALKIGVLDWSA